MPDKPIEIVIVEKPNGFLEPLGGKNTPVKSGQTVVFTAEAGVEKPSLKISFRGKSPFNGAVAYGTALTVTATFAKNKPAANIFVYDCSFTKNGRQLASEGGGQIEIASSDR
jgi:hypothetical protein